MTWREHINVLSHKANTTIAFLRRNLKPCSSHIKANSYLSYVRPIIEYSSTVWDLNIKEDIHKLEMVQRRTARFVYNNYNCTDSVTSMFQSLHWPTLEVRRQFLKLILMFKILKDQIHIPTHNFQPVTISIQEGTNITICIFSVTVKLTDHPFFHQQFECGMTYLSKLPHP